MPLTAAVAGPYTGVWDAIDYGQTQDGFRLSIRTSWEAVRSASYGDSVVDLIYRGGECFLTFSGVEYNKLDDVNAGSLNLSVLAPYSATGSSGLGTMGQVGRLASGSSLVGSSVLTRVIAATTSLPTTFTAVQSILAEDHMIEILAAPRHRIIPLMLRCLPYTSTGDRWFTVA